MALDLKFPYEINPLFQTHTPTFKSLWMGMYMQSLYPVQPELSDQVLHMLVIVTQIIQVPYHHHTLN